MNEREYATVLAALRWWQFCTEFSVSPMFAGFQHLEGGPLTLREIDALCEKLNFSEVCDNLQLDECSECGLSGVHKLQCSRNPDRQIKLGGEFH